MTPASGVAPSSGPAALERWATTVQVVAVVYDGRSGTALLHSLFDNHPEVLQAPLDYLSDFPQFWARYGGRPTTELMERVPDYFPVIFDTRKDTFTRLNRLGVEQDEYVVVDAAEFIRRLYAWIGGGPVNRRKFFVALHLAYAEVLGQPLTGRHVLPYAFHNPLRMRELRDLNADFPSLKVLFSTREPFASHASLFRAFVAYRRLSRGAAACLEDGLWRTPLTVYEKAFLAPDALKQALTPERVRAVRLEDLHLKSEPTMRRIAAWIGIEFTPSLLQSTYFGKLWWGDVMNPPMNGFSRHVFGDRWKKDYWRVDILRLKYLWRKQLAAYGYESPQAHGWLAKSVVWVLLPVPTRWEVRLWGESLSLLLWPPLHLRMLRLIAEREARRRKEGARLPKVVLFGAAKYILFLTAPLRMLTKVGSRIKLFYRAFANASSTKSMTFEML